MAADLSSDMITVIGRTVVVRILIELVLCYIDTGNTIIPLNYHANPVMLDHGEGRGSAIRILRYYGVNEFLL
jgi:hypothetical protein